MTCRATFRRAGGVVAVVLLCAASVACGDDGTGAPVATPVFAASMGADEWSQQGGPVVLSQTPFISDSANAIALAEGTFGELGVDVDVERTRSSEALIPSLATGAVDVVFAGTFPGVFNLIAAGEPLVAVAGGSVFDPAGCPHFSLMVLPDTLDEVRFDDPDTLRGFRIGERGASFAGRRYIEAMVDEWGLDLDDVTLVELDREVLPAALGRGDIDGAVVQEPWVTTMERELGAVSTNLATEILPNEITSFLLFGERLVADRELGVRVLAAYLLGEQQYRQGATDRNVEILSESTGLEADPLREMCWPTIDSDGRRHVEALSSLIEYGVAIGDIEHPPTPEQVWDPTFRDDALRLLEELGHEVGAS